MLRRFAAAAALIALALLVPGGVASAHAIVDDILPADGSALADDPGQVVIRFSEPILDEGLTVELVSSVGVAEQPTGSLDPADPSVVIVDLPPLPDGTHQVRVSARDREDLHEVIARTSFGIGTAPPPASAPTVAAPEGLESMARWLFAGGLAALVGVLVFRSRWPDVPISRPGRLQRITVGAIVAVLLARLGILVARAISLGGDLGPALRTVASTGDAQRLIFVTVAAACLAPLALSLRAVWLDMPLRERGRMSVRLALGWVGVVWLALLASWGDHSALEGAVEPVVALAKAGHLLGLGLWIGSLAIALAVNAGPSARSALISVSRVAILGAVLAVGTGVLLASRLVVSLTGLFSSSYGRLLVAKIVLIAAVALLGIGVRRGWRLRWSVAELALLGLVVLGGSLMATAGPAIERSFLTAPDAASADLAAVLADDLLVQVRAIPGVPGPNTLEFRVSDTRRPAPGPITGITVAVDGAGGDAIEPAVLTPNDDGFAYLDNVELVSGITDVRAEVTRDEWPVADADLEVVAEVVPYLHPTVISSAPLQNLLRLVGGVLVALAVVLGARLIRSTKDVDDLVGGEPWEAESLASS